MSAWVEWKKELGVSTNIYEVWRRKDSEELILLMRAWDVYVVVVKLGPKEPTNESISVLELNKAYNSTSESIGNFLSAATKKYGGAERVRELILSIERPGLNPTLKELEMAKKATKSKKEAPAPKAKKNAAKVEEAVIEGATKIKASSSAGEKIKLLVKDNPKREGSASFDRFELYRTSKTVEEFIANGGTRGDIANDAKKGYIQLA